MTKETIQIIKPDDWHLHLRDGALLESAVPYTARRNARAIVMPNLVPPVINATLANAYKQRILNCLEPESSTFTPLMTMYLTESTSPEDIYESIGHVHALKWYPAGATTNSDSGVKDINNCYEVLQVMQANNIPLLIHGEVTDKDIDIFDREAVFIERHLKQIINDFPKLKIVLEHITTQQAAEFVASAPDNVAATITVHHLLLNRNAMLAGGIRPHYYCLPILKREQHRLALVKAATSGSPKFFLGTDSAPHPKGAKESACGCAGIFTAHASIELYAEVFENENALEKLENFASVFGPQFYGLEVNSETITLEKTDTPVPEIIHLGGKECVPFRAGELLKWKLVSD
jgi:dihydroorotase